MKRIRFILLLIIVACGQTLWAGPKIDTLYFNHGDRVTGEVLDLSYNRLRLKTDDAGTLKFEWNKMDSVMILNTMRIVLDNGKILYGQVHPGDDEGTGTIRAIGMAPMWLYLSRIVSLTPMEERILDRLGGAFSSGFSYTKSSDVMQFNINSTINYEAQRNHLELFYDGNLSNDPVSGSNQRQKGGFNYRRYLPKKWFVLAQWLAETSSEMDLDHRLTFEMAGGNSLIFSNRMRLDLGLGIAANREQSVELSAYNLEALLTAQYSIFIYEAPDVSFDLLANLKPGLTDLGRIRAELDSNLRWEVFNDFFLKWTFYYSFDSSPLSESEDAERNDWAITMLGIEYKL